MKNNLEPVPYLTTKMAKILGDDFIAFYLAYLLIISQEKMKLSRCFGELSCHEIRRLRCNIFLKHNLSFELELRRDMTAEIQR